MNSKHSILDIPFNQLLSRDRMAIMGCAMLVIMLFHQEFFRGNLLVDAFHLCGFWGVDIFLLISGFGLAHSLRKHSITTYYRNRFVRLLPSCVLVGSAKLALSHLGFTELTSNNVLLQVTSLYMWYIFAIVIYYLLAPFIFRALNRFGIWVLVATCVVAFACTFLPYSHYPGPISFFFKWVPGRLPVFVLGMYMAIHPLCLSNKQLLMGGAILFVTCLILRVAHIRTHLNLTLLALAVPAMCIAGSYVKATLDRVRCGSVFEFLGKYSLEIYLWHGFIFANMHKNAMFADIPAALNMTLAVAVSLTLAYVTHWLAGKIGQLVK